MNNLKDRSYIKHINILVYDYIKLLTYQLLTNLKIA